MTREIVSVDTAATAMDVANKMKSENVGTVLVLDGSVLKGLVTDRQLATKVVASGKDPAKVGVSEFMTSNPITVNPDMDIHDAVKIMGEHGYRRIPVLMGDKPVGILSTVDLAEHALACKYCMQNIFGELRKAER